MTVLLFGALILALYALYRQKRRMNRMTSQVEHFLLYPEDPLPESITEGSSSNLENQISRLEQLLLHQRDAAAQNEQQMTRFVENMAHQMKNSLTALQIQLDIAELQAPDSAAMKKCQACMTRLSEEIAKILTSSQLAEGKVRMAFEPLDLQRELSDIALRLAPMAKEKEVSVRIAANGITLSADPFWFSQALENILINAIEHTPCGTTVTVACAEKGPNVRIEVSDAGPGLTPETLELLFVRFHRGETAKRGYGIGLSMAKDIVTAHHGTIAARNGAPRGAVVEILLPNLLGTKPYER